MSENWLQNELSNFLFRLGPTSWQLKLIDDPAFSDNQCCWHFSWKMYFGFKFYRCCRPANFTHETLGKMYNYIWYFSPKNIAILPINTTSNFLCFRPILRPTVLHPAIFLLHVSNNCLTKFVLPLNLPPLIRYDIEISSLLRAIFMFQKLTSFYYWATILLFLLAGRSFTKPNVTWVCCKMERNRHENKSNAYFIIVWKTD